MMVGSYMDESFDPTHPPLLHNPHAGSPALDAAHRMSMVHRDIKPDNIMLANCADGDLVTVLDFGIAKLKGSGTESSSRNLVDTGNQLALTGPGATIDTTEYMSTEQVRGETDEELDCCSEIYSLGVVAYQMLTCELPMTGTTPFEKLGAQVQTLQGQFRAQPQLLTSLVTCAFWL